jgi:RNA polymerase sigma factor (sigma-70 family)
MSNVPLQGMELEQVAQGCRAEAQRSRALETGYCFELFRRAIEALDQRAWALIAEQYQRLILEWVHGAAEPALAEELAREAFERFWRTLAGRCNPLAGRFPHVGALLKYLQQCAISTVLDRRRRTQQQTRLHERLQQHASLDGAISPGPEEMVIEEVDRTALLKRVQHWVAHHVTDPRERLVLQLSYTSELSPLEIAQRYPQQFADAANVRQIKERVLRRARRALLDSVNEEITTLSGQ